MVETDDDDAKDQAPEGNLRNCTLRENNVKEQVEGVVLASKTGDKVESRQPQEQYPTCNRLKTSCRCRNIMQWDKSRENLRSPWHGGSSGRRVKFISDLRSLHSYHQSLQRFKGNWKDLSIYLIFWFLSSRCFHISCAKPILLKTASQYKGKYLSGAS